jgi:acyl carrier protein
LDYSDGLTGMEMIGGDMNRSEVMAELITIVEGIKKLTYDREQINETSYLGGDLGVHSVEMLEAMFDLQNRFQIKIEDRDLVELYSVKDVLDMLEKYIHQVNDK